MDGGWVTVDPQDRDAWEAFWQAVLDDYEAAHETQEEVYVRESQAEAVR